MSHSKFRNSLQYCKYYCEENIWQLCAQSKFIDDAWVLFISNPQNHFVIWNQKLGDAGAPIVWDYHVILLAKENEKYKIFDFDSQLDFGCDVDYYFSNSFPQVEIPDELAPRFMIQSTKFFREHFQSNREHMKDEKGDFVEPEPSWKKISEESNLDKYLEMNTDKNYIVDLNEIRTTSWSLITERCYS